MLVSYTGPLGSLGWWIFLDLEVCWGSWSRPCARGCSVGLPAALRALPTGLHPPSQKVSQNNLSFHSPFLTWLCLLVCGEIFVFLDLFWCNPVWVSYGRRWVNQRLCGLVFPTSTCALQARGSLSSWLSCSTGLWSLKGSSVGLICLLGMTGEISPHFYEKSLPKSKGESHNKNNVAGHLFQCRSSLTRVTPLIMGDKGLKSCP